MATRLWEHLDPHHPLKSSIPKYLSECEHANFILNSNHIFDNLNDINDSDADKPDTPLSFYNLIQIIINTKILLLFLEVVYIKYRNPVLNNGLKASKELAVLS